MFFTHFMFPHGQGTTNRSGWCPKTPPRFRQKTRQELEEEKGRYRGLRWVFFLVPSEPDGPGWVFSFLRRWMRGLETNEFQWVQKNRIIPFQEMFNHETHCELQIFFGRTQGYGIWFFHSFFSSCLGWENPKICVSCEFVGLWHCTDSPVFSNARTCRPW